MPQTEDKSIGPALLEKWALGYLERFASSAENLRRRGPQGQWLPGSSPNPGGRPKIIEDIRDLAREHTETAINALVHIAESGKQESARVAAASALLDRGWGKPTQPLSGDKDAPPIGLSIEA